MSETLDPVTLNHLRRTSDTLDDEFAGIFSKETIERYLAESLDLLGESRVNVFVPVLAHRFARERLRALAQAEGTIVKEQPESPKPMSTPAERSSMPGVDACAIRYKPSA